MIDHTSFPYTSLARQPSCSSIAGLPRSDAYRCAGRLGDQILAQLSTSIDSRVTKRHMADHVGPGLAAAATLRSPSPTPLGLSTFGWAVPAADRDGFPSARMVLSRDRKVQTPEMSDRGTSSTRVTTSNSDGRGGFPDAFRLHPGGRPWVPVSRCAIPLRVPCGNWCPPTTGFVGGCSDVAALFFGHSSGTSIPGVWRGDTSHLWDYRIAEMANVNKRKMQSVSERRLRTALQMRRREKE
jgi:hypothetical protein